ncbi:Hypothetical predicted protein, partial [Marmota monax]
GGSPETVMVYPQSRRPQPQEGRHALRPEVDSILVDGRGNFKLIDFSLSTRPTAGQKLTKLYLKSSSGKSVRAPVDIWSLGVILHLMLTGRCPVMATTSKQLKKRIVQG